MQIALGARGAPHKHPYAEVLQRGARLRGASGYNIIHRNVLCGIEIHIRNTECEKMCVCVCVCVAILGIPLAMFIAGILLSESDAV